MKNENNSQNKNACFPVVGGTANNRETDLEINLKWYTFGLKYRYTFGALRQIWCKMAILRLS
jgi:hypothetical protein